MCPTLLSNIGHETYTQHTDITNFFSMSYAHARRAHARHSRKFVTVECRGRNVARYTLIFDKLTLL